MFYTNVLTLGNRVCVRSIENGERRNIEMNLAPPFLSHLKTKMENLKPLMEFQLNQFSQELFVILENL